MEKDQEFPDSMLKTRTLVITTQEHYTWGVCSLNRSPKLT